MTGALEVLSMVLVAVLAAGVVFTRDPLPQSMVFSLYGSALVIFVTTLGAPDVTLSAIVVGLVAFPIMILLTLAKVRGRAG